MCVGLPKPRRCIQPFRRGDVNAPITLTQFLAGATLRYVAVRVGKVEATYRHQSRYMPWTGEIILRKPGGKLITCLPMPAYEARNFYNLATLDVA